MARISESEIEKFIKKLVMRKVNKNVDFFYGKVRGGY